MHSPEYAQEMADARRLGGLRRRREVAVSGAYKRIVEIGVLDTLGLENSIARSRTLAYLAMAILEVGELEQRIAVLEGAVHGRSNLPESPFDAEPTGSGFSVEVHP